MAKVATALKALDNAIETKKFLPVYVFTGEERGLLVQYISDIKKCFKNVVEDSSLSDVAKDTSFNTLWGGKKLYILNNTDFFNKTATDEEIMMLVKLYKQKSNTVIFVETNINNTYKQTKSLGEESVVEFKKLSQDAIERIVKQIMKVSKKKFADEDDQVAPSFIADLCNYDYTTVLNEMHKLVSTDAEVITIKDIKRTVTRSTYAVVFDLIELIANKKHVQAFDLYRNLILRKEIPLTILALIYRQFRLMFQCKMLLDERRSFQEIAQAINEKPYSVNKTAQLVRNFEYPKIESIIKKCAEVDIMIKSGKLKDEQAVLMLIAFIGM